MAEQRDIKYTGKDFNSLKQQLVDYAKNYFPDTYNDFSPSSPGMMFMEIAAYVGDVLNYYQDIQYQETLLQYAQEPSNLYALAYMMGYSPKISTAANATIDIYQRVAAVTSNGVTTPNWEQALTIPGGTELESTSKGNVSFYVEDRVDFSLSSSYSPTEVTVWSQDTNGTVNAYLLKKSVSAISGEVVTKEVQVGSVEKYFTTILEDSEILGILSVTDSEGNDWTEVPYLAQSTVFTEDSTTAGTFNTLQLKKVPRRFVTRFNSNGNLQVQFGAGISDQSDEVITPNPSNVGLGTFIQTSKLDVAYDPANFMQTQEYGLAPNNTTLTIKYLKGGGVAANVPANTITKVKAQGTVSGTDTSQSNTISYNNPRAATGGKGPDSVEEIRQNALKASREQLRAVTADDYVVRTLSLPARYGSIAKAYVVQDQLTSKQSTTDGIIDSNPLSLSIYVLGYDYDRKLKNADTLLKSNIQTYLSQYRMISDAINIKDAFIVNIGVEFEVILTPDQIAREVLLNCNTKIRDYFDIRKWNINQPIDISKLYVMLDRVKGVQSVKRVSLNNKVGGQYSRFAYDVPGSIKGGVLYPSYDPCIFEVKFPETDIIGRVTTL